MSRCPQAPSNVQRIAGYLDRRIINPGFSLAMLICERKILQSFLSTVSRVRAIPTHQTLTDSNFLAMGWSNLFGAFCVHVHVNSTLPVPVNAGGCLTFIVGCFGVLTIFQIEAIDPFVASMQVLSPIFCLNLFFPLPYLLRSPQPPRSYA